MLIGYNSVSWFSCGRRCSDLVEKIVDLLELLRSQRTRIDSLDLSAEVLEHRGIGSRGNGQGQNFDSHGVRSSVKAPCKKTEWMYGSIRDVQPGLLTC